MNALTNSERFSALPELISEKGDDVMMTILFDEAEARGEDQLSKLIQILLAEKAYDKIQRVTDDKEYRHKLYSDYGINSGKESPGK